MKKKMLCLLLIAGLLIPGVAALADDDIPERPYDDSGTLEDISETTPQQAMPQQITPGGSNISDAISVYVAGKQVLFQDQAPVIQDGRTLLPVRAVSEAMSKTVNYNDGIVTISDGDKKMTLMIGKRVVSYVDNDSTSAGTLDTAPVVFNGRTMLPIRAIAEFFGYQVNWNDATRVVDLV